MPPIKEMMDKKLIKGKTIIVHNIKVPEIKTFEDFELQLRIVKSYKESFSQLSEYDDAVEIFVPSFERSGIEIMYTQQ